MVEVGQGRGIACCCVEIVERLWKCVRPRREVGAFCYDAGIIAPGDTDLRWSPACTSFFSWFIRLNTLLFQLDLLHIDDCVDGFLLTIKHLTSSLSKPSHTYLEVFDLASGSSVSISTIVSILATLTQTKSPIRYIQVDNRFPDLHRGSIEKSERILGYKPSISVTDGLHKLVRTYLKQTEHFLAAKTSSTCGRASPSLETDSDEHMDKLDKCKVHVDVNIHGEFVALVPPAEGKRDGWNTSTDMPPPDLETVISNSHPGSGRHGPKRLIRILARDKGPVYLGAKKMSEPQPGPVVFENIKDEDIANLGDAEVFVDWELEVNTEQGTVRLVVPGTNLVLMGPTFVGSNFSLVEMEGSGGGPSGKQRKVWPMRISPICCPAPAPWPFFRDDRKFHISLHFRRILRHSFLLILVMVGYQRSILRSSIRKTRSSVHSSLLLLKPSVTASNMPESRSCKTLPGFRRVFESHLHSIVHLILVIHSVRIQPIGWIPTCQRAPMHATILRSALTREIVNVSSLRVLLFNVTHLHPLLTSLSFHILLLLRELLP